MSVAHAEYQIVHELFFYCTCVERGKHIFRSNYPWNVSNANTQLTATRANPVVWTGLWQLALALLFRCVFTTFSVGTKVPTGLFIPNMIIGAVCGRIVGVLVEQFAVYVFVCYVQ